MSARESGSSGRDVHPAPGSPAGREAGDDHAAAGPNTVFLLRAAAAGDDSAVSRLMPIVYDELRAIARQHLAHEGQGHTLPPTALAHEAYLRLVGQGDADWQGRAHFLSVASTMVRRILVDHARRKAAAKRGRDARRVPLAGLDLSTEVGVDLLELDDALERLRAIEPRQARVVELRFFGGLSIEETATILEVSLGTVKGDWRVARAWLQQELID